MLTHYAQAENLHMQLKTALDMAYSTHDNFSVCELASALAISAMFLQYYHTESHDVNYTLLQEVCGAPKVIETFDYRNPCQHFEWRPNLSSTH